MPTFLAVQFFMPITLNDFLHPRPLVRQSLAIADGPFYREPPVPCYYFHPKWLLQLLLSNTSLLPRSSLGTNQTW